MAFESVDTRRWLTITLNGIPALVALVKGIHDAELPPRSGLATQDEDSEVLPAVVFNPQSPGTDTNAMDGRRALSSQLWLVKVVGIGEDVGAIETAANLIDAVLQGTRALRAGYRLTWKRESVVDYLERDGNRSYRHLGGLYRCDLSGAGTG